MVSCEMDFRVGGKYRYVLRKANGKEYAFRGEFLEIVRRSDWFRRSSSKGCRVRSRSRP